MGNVSHGKGSQVESGDRSRGPGLKWVGVAPALAVLLPLVLLALDPGPVPRVPFLSEILSTVFLSFVYLAVAYLAAKAYVKEPLPQVPWLGTGSLVMGTAGLSIWIYSSDMLNLSLVLANGGYLLASLFLAAGAAVWLAGARPPGQPEVRRRAIVAAYAGAFRSWA